MRHSSFINRHSAIITDLLLLAGFEAFMMAFLDVRVLFYDTVVTGGDTASWHGVADHLLRVLLPSGRLTGWDLGNFCGYPNFSFYFLPPFLLAALPSALFGVPLTITLKISISLGVFLLPLTTYLGLRAMNYRFPGPIIGAGASLLFLFNESYNMFGGNILSTYTGEFCYMLTFALFAWFMGSLYRGVETERGVIRNGILLGLIGLSHLFVFIPAVCLLLYWFLVKGRLRYLLKISLLGFGLMAFWILPLMAYRHPYTTPVYMIWQQFVSWRYTFLGIGLLLLFVGPRLCLAALGGSARHQIPPTPPEAEKKSVWPFLSSFRRKPESRIPGLRRDDVWTPVFTGVTAKREFFHTFPLAKGGWGLGMIVFSVLFTFTLSYLGATWLVLGPGLFDTGIELAPLSASPLGAERALLLKPWIVPFSLFLSAGAMASGFYATMSPSGYERFCLAAGSTTFQIAVLAAAFALYGIMVPAIPGPGLRGFFLKTGTRAGILFAVFGLSAWLLFFHRPLRAAALKRASESRADRFGMLLGLSAGCVVGYFGAHYLQVPDIRFLPPLLFALLLILFVDTLEPLLAPCRQSTRAAAALFFSYGCVLVVLFGTTRADYWFEYNNKGYEWRPGYPEFREANDYLRKARPDPLNAPRVGYEKCGLYGAYGGDRVFESLLFFAGRQTMEGIHYASSMASRPIAFLQTAYSRDVKTPRSYILSRLNAAVLPAYFDLYNISQLIVMTDEAHAAVGASPHFEKQADFGDISIYRYRDCDGRYVDVPARRPLLYGGKDWAEDFFRWYKAGNHLDLLMVPEGFVRDGMDRAAFGKEIAAVDDLGGVVKDALDRTGLRIETRLERHRIRFTTNRPGLPHLIKVSYYPNWKVEGARGVYPVSPHLMVVVPRENEVVLTYGRTLWDRVGIGITCATLLFLVVWALASVLSPPPLDPLPPGEGRRPVAGGAGMGLQLRALPALAERVWERILPESLVLFADRLRPCLGILLLLGASAVVTGGAISRNEPVRVYVSGYREYKNGMDLLQEGKRAAARAYFEKAIRVMAPMVEGRAGYDHQDVIHCMLFTALCREHLGEPALAEILYRTILEDYPYSRYVGEAYVKIGRLKRAGRSSLMEEGLQRLKAGDPSGDRLLERALAMTQEALHYFRTAIREDPYSVWAEYGRNDIRFDQDYLRGKQPLIETLARGSAAERVMAEMLR